MRRSQRPLNKTRRKCPSRKIRFRDEHEANRSLNHHQSDRPEHPTRAYYCQLCDGWHLTKQEYSQGPRACGHCGAPEGEKHELSCDTVSPAEYFARTGGRARMEGSHDR